MAGWGAFPGYLVRAWAGGDATVGDAAGGPAGYRGNPSDGVYECLLASAPLNSPGGIGSPANALALK